ncbi:hypothetical protein PENTCL1PPCAC_17230, partial [Pristionchus entomophagus]
SSMATRKTDASTEAKNLMMIRRIDICAESILDKATHTALYKFNTTARAWEKTEVDGAMFIYKRADHPVYSLMIANRQSPEDLIEPILPKIRVKMDKPYLFFCKVDGSIQGLWFYQEADCERIYNLLNKIISELRQEAKVSPLPKAAGDQPSASSSGFLSMLMGGAPTGSPPKSLPSPLSPAVSTPVANAKQAAQVKPVKQATQQQQQTQTSYVTWISPLAVKPQQQQPMAEVTAVPSMLQKLMSEQLPPSLGGAAATNGPMSAADLERDLLRQSRVNELVLQGMNPSVSAASLAAYSNQSIHGSDAGDIAELESMAGALSIGVDQSEGGTRPPLSPTGSTRGLDKHQLAMGLVQLLQTDDEFLGKVHQAYVEALNRRIGA